MTEYIRKADAVDVVEYANGNMTWAERDDCKKRLEELSPVDVAPVVHEKWKVFPVDDWKGRRTGKHRIICGCGYTKTIWHSASLPRFCEECGAKMDGKQGE